MNETIITDTSEHKLDLRNLQLEDYADLKAIMDIVYPSMSSSWTEKKFRKQLSTFPEGQICIENHGKVVAAAFS